MFILNTLQEFVTMTEILTPISTDHSPVLLSLSKEKCCLRGKGIREFDSSLTKDQEYIIKIKKMIRRKLLKHEVRNITINYTKYIAKENRQERTNPEKQLKIREKI